ncbi:MAG: potassium/proton antiporter [Actinobacteria bacterium]|nr:potassium/proton antiporter [Actinomycetota bacterium]
MVAYLLAAVAGSTDPPAADALDAGLAVDRPLLVGAWLLIVGSLTAVLAARLRLPAALSFLAVGMVVGDDGLDWISLSDPVLVQSLGVGALVIILFEGGLTTDVRHLRRGAAPGVVLATVGVLITAGITALGAMWLLDVPSRAAWLVGAIVASTDAAAVFDLLRRAPLPERLSAVLKIESGANDPVAVLLTVGLLSAWITPPSAAAWVVFGAAQLIGGVAVGVAAGWSGGRLFHHIRDAARGWYPIVGLAIAGATYGVAATLGASGFLATYIAGIVLAIETPRHRASLRSFHTALANGAEVGLFLLLGLLVFPSQLPGIALTALGLVALLVLVGRPLACAVTLAPMGFSARGIAAVSWLGLRGAVPIVLATFAHSAGIPGATTIFHAVFFVVLVSALVQGTTAVPVITALGLATRPSTTDVIADALPISDTGLDVIEVELPDDSRLVGQLLREAMPPPDVLVAAVVRNDRVLLPRGDTRLCPGDLLIVTSADRDHGIAGIEAWVRAQHPRTVAAAPEPTRGPTKT